jgi:5-methylthioadenosine/S-adenosylhomocysteine deaminase
MMASDAVDALAGANAPCDVLITGLDVLVDEHTLIEDAVIEIEQGTLRRVAARGARRVNAPESPDYIAAKRRLHLPDRLAIAGLINIHSHAALCMLRGVAEDLGFAPAYTPGVPGGASLTPGEAAALARLGALEALRFGTTLLVDTYVHALHTLPAMADLGLRVCASPRIHDADLALLGKRQWHFDPAIGEATLEEAITLAERWPRRSGARLSTHLAVHAPDTCSSNLWRKVSDAAQSLGLPIATHLAQSRVELDAVRTREGCGSAEYLERLGLLGPGLIAAHCIYLDEADIARCGRAGMTVAHIPKGNATGGSLAPIPQLAAAGARITLGTDNMHGDMIEVLRWALALGRLHQGRVDQTWQPEHVFRAATLGGAQALGLAHELGSLHAGKRADLVIVDLRSAHLNPVLRPLGSLVHTGQGNDVQYVLVDGEIVIEDGEPTRTDRADVIAEANQAVRAAWRRAGAMPARTGPPLAGQAAAVGSTSTAGLSPRSA